MMNKFYLFQKAIVLTLATLTSSIASAGLIDFKAMAEPSGVYGESIWDTLTIIQTGFKLDITATQSGSTAAAYLDAGNAGLGVCDSVKVGGIANAATNSSTNQCWNAGDDNVTFGEALRFVFNVDVVINDIWFNNNHDGDKSLLNNTISINGAGHTFTSGPAIGPADFAVGKSYLVKANIPFDISFFGVTENPGDQFYVSKIDVSAAPIPEPSAWMLLLIGLLGLSVTRKRVLTWQTA